MKYENKYKPKDRIFDGWAILITWLIFWILIFDNQFNFIFKLLFIVVSWLSLFSMNITLVQLKIGVSVMYRNNAVHHNWKWSNCYVSMSWDSRPRSVLTTIISRKLEDLKSKWFEILSVIFCLTNIQSWKYQRTHHSNPFWWLDQILQFHKNLQSESDSLFLLHLMLCKIW